MRQHAFVDEFLDEIGLGAVERNHHHPRLAAMMLAVMVLIVIVTAELAAAVAIVAVLTGVCRNCDAGQRCDQRHRRCDRKECLQCHENAP
ncbi:MAG: hypothetical protein QM757_27265 [Paludibaculum sp.]